MSTENRGASDIAEFAIVAGQTALVPAVCSAFSSSVTYAVTKDLALSTKVGSATGMLAGAGLGYVCMATDFRYEASFNSLMGGIVGSGSGILLSPVVSNALMYTVKSLNF